MALKGHDNDVANHDDLEGFGGLGEYDNFLSSSTLRSLGEVKDKVESALAKPFP